MQYVTPRYENLTRIACERKVRSFLEIGTWKGITAENFLQTALSYAPEGEILYVGVDLFDLLTKELEKKEHSKPMSQLSDVWGRLARFGQYASLRVELLQGFSRDVLPCLDFDTFDMIYIDGGHLAATIAEDWGLVQRLIGDDTVVVFDDYRHDDPGVGCKELINGLDRDLWNVEILEPTETFAFGDMNFAQVTREV